MTRDQAMACIRQGLEKALKRHDVDFGEETDLIKESILDSLDSMVFLVEVAELSGKEFPEVDLVEADFFKVDRLVQYLTEQ